MPFSSVRGSGFWSSEPAILALHLLQIILDASHREAFVGLARSALGGLSDVALLEWHLALEKCERAEDESCFALPEFQPSREADALAYGTFVSRLEIWRDLARVAPFSEVLEEVLAASDLAFYEAGLSDGATREGNWRKVVDLVRAREADGQGGLRSLIDGFSSLMEEALNGEDEAEAPLPGQASIQLLTVWAAKGLGFPMTILAQLDATPRPPGSALLRGQLNGQRQMAWSLNDDDAEEKAPKPWLWEKLRAGETAEEEAEWRRLFYVAVTRAESQLLLVRPEQDVRSGAAWINLCAPGYNELQEMVPVLAIPRAGSNSIHNSPQQPPLSAPPPLQRAAPHELALSEVAGPPAERFTARARTWVENRLDFLGGEAEEARQDIPFSMSQGKQWLVGAWEWLAPLPDGTVLLVASGETPEIARMRAQMMGLAAKNAGFEVRENWAIWSLGEHTGQELVTQDHGE